MPVKSTMAIPSFNCIELLISLVIFFDGIFIFFLVNIFKLPIIIDIIINAVNISSLLPAFSFLFSLFEPIFSSKRFS